MKNVLTKRKVLLVSGIGSAIFVLNLSLVLYELCGRYESICKEVYSASAGILFFFPAGFIFSLITYFLPEKIFRTWIHFAVWWVPLSIITTLFLPHDCGGSLIIICADEAVAYALSLLFVVISISIIVVSWIKDRRKEV